MPRPAPLFAALCLLSLLGGCKTLSELRGEKALQQTLDRYAGALRWGQWASVAELRAADAKPMPALDFDNIRITGYEVVLPPVMKAAPKDEKGETKDEDTQEAMQLVRIEYVLRDQQRVRRVQDRQIWRLDPETGQWRLTSDFPELK